MRYALSICATCLLIPGCAVAPNNDLAARLSFGSAPQAYVATATSWMAQGAQKDDLLYVGSVANAYVFVFSYPQAKLVGTLGGFATAPLGLCSDDRGNVFIVDAQQVIEYAHGGVSPIATLTPDDYPNGCAVDKTTGNLAVAGGSPHHAQANVAIYVHERGSPTIYDDASAPALYFCAYDDDGNLFVNEGGGYVFALQELAKNSGTFRHIGVAGRIASGGAVAWDGAHLVVGDPHGNQHRRGPTTLFVLHLNGVRARVVKKIELNSGNVWGRGSRNPGTPVQFWIDRGTIVNPLHYGRGIGLWSYPLGGDPVEVARARDIPYGVTISHAPHSR